MRLWHEKLLEKLPQKQLSGQWREVIGLLGNSWGKKHSTVDYVFNYPVELLYLYAMKVHDEMIRRGYKPKITCIISALNRRDILLAEVCKNLKNITITGDTIYYEHNSEYMEECLNNLKRKGITIK